MSPKFGEKSPMSTADVMGVTRSMAEHLVARAENETGSRMEAYVRVARDIGVSPDWIRKFIKGSEQAKEPRATAWLNIIKLHDRICERIEQTAANQRTQAAALREQLNAAMGGDLRTVERMAGTAANGSSNATDVSAD
jgi:DNA-binding transcriptional MerR regulator